MRRLPQVDSSDESIARLHHLAMAAADEGKHLRAAEFERAAAKRAGLEPTRSVLHRSAAWLFIDAGQFGDALLCVLDGLTTASNSDRKNVPQEIKAEMADVLVAIAAHYRESL